MAVHAGSWLGLPDFGITEAVGRVLNRPTTSQGGSNIVGSTNQAASFTPTTSTAVLGVTAPYGPTYSGPQSRPSGGGSTAAPTAPAGQNQNNLQNQLQGGLGQVDSDYNNYISTLNTQEGNVRRSAENATGALDAAYNPARTSIQQQQTQANSAYDTQSQQANKQAGTSLQQARDLYRQLQQQNIAQLSGSGLSSSSVAEALAENLGVETARRIAGVTGSRDEVLQNIEKERTNMGQYVQQRLSDLDQQLASEKAKIQTQLLNQIDQINNARNVAANERSSRRQQLLLDAQNSAAQLEAQAQQFAQDLQKWQVQNQQRLSQTAVNFDDLNKAMEFARSMQGMGIGQPQQQAQGQGAYYINPGQQKNPYEFDYSQYGL